MIRESDIVHEQGEFWVLQTAKGFEVYQNGTTCSTRCAVIGFRGDEGMKRAKAEIERRISLNRVMAKRAKR